MIVERSKQAGIGDGSSVKRLRPELHIVQTAADPPVISVEGELDLATGPELVECVEALTATHPTDVGLDLGQVGFIDLAGLSALVRVSRHVRQLGGRFRLVAPSPPVVRLIALTGLEAELGGGVSEAPHSNPATSEVRPLRVLLVTDAEVIARGLAALLKDAPDRIRLLGPVARTDVGSAVTSSRADVVLVDIDGDGAADLGDLERVIASDGDSRFVAFTSSTDERRLFEALRIGAAGYLLKSLDALDLVNHLDRARNDQVVVDPALSSRLALAVGRSADQLARSRGGWPGAHLGLTLRESDVLRLLIDGLSNREIAARLYLGQETVKTHLRSVYRKLDVQGRTQAMSRAIRDGMLD